MNKNGPILVIEDDLDDQQFLKDVFIKLNYGNEIIFFNDGDDALTFLDNSPNLKPFLILSDINMPKLNGFALRDKVHNNEQLRLRCIPYLFFTTTNDQKAVIDAYSKSIQGFFVKPDDPELLEQTIKAIMDYWRLCTSPNYI